MDFKIYAQNLTQRVTF